MRRARGPHANEPAVHIRRTVGHHGLAATARRHHRVRRRRRAAAGRGPGPAAPRAKADHGHRGRHHRAAHQAGPAADLHQRDARRVSRPDAAGHHRHVSLRPARVPGLRLHGRRPDRPARQREHERARPGLLEAEGAAARNRWRQRHRLAVQGGHHPDRAREASVRRARRLRHQSGVAGRRRLAPARRPAVRRRVARGHHARRLRLRSRDAPDAAGRSAPRRDARAGPRADGVPAPRGAGDQRHPGAVGGRAGDAARARPRAPLPRITFRDKETRAVHVGLAIKNFVGPTETPDVDALYRYAERAEALGFESLRAWARVTLQVDEFNLREAVMRPKTVQRPRPPILIGGYVDTVLKRVATRGDGWLTYFYTPESYAKSWQKILGFARDAGRDPRTLTGTNQLAILVGASRAETEAPMRHWLSTEWDVAAWSESTIEHAIRGSVKECVEQLRAHVASGVDRLILIPYRYEPAQVQIIAREILPALRCAAEGRHGRVRRTAVR